MDLNIIYDIFKKEIDEVYEKKKKTYKIINENPGSSLWCYKMNLISLKANNPLVSLDKLLENNVLSNRITLELNVLTNEENDLHGNLHTKTSPEDIQNGWVRFSIQSNLNNEVVCNVEARFEDWAIAVAKWGKKKYKDIPISKYYIDYYNEDGEPKYKILDYKFKVINNENNQ